MKQMSPASFLVTVLLVLGVMIPFFALRVAAQGSPSGTQPYEASDMKGLQERLGKYAPYALQYDTSRLSDGEKAALETLVRAGNLIDRIFLEQLHERNWEIFQTLRERYEQNTTDANRMLLEYFWFNKSPYDQANDDAPNSLFLEGQGLSKEMEPGRNFYPKGMTEELVQRWVDSLDGDARAAALSDFTAIQGNLRGDDVSGLETVPYSKAYAEWLEPLAATLERASKQIPGTTLSKFLESRAQAFRTNDYEESEGLWIGMNDLEDPGRGSVDLTLGPYENYMDELLKKKASFQFYLGVLRPEKTAALQLYRKHVHSMDEYLWELFQTYYGEEGTVRWTPPGAAVNLVAIDVVYATGMGNQGVQTLAFNLPNVEAWQEKFGTKKVMLMNILDGKFEKILKPIAGVVLAEGDVGFVVSDLFTDNTVRHEVAHGIGPSTIFVPVPGVAGDGSGFERTKDAAGNEITVRKTTVRDRMQRFYSAFEEAKAEIVSLLFGYHLAEQGAIRNPQYTRRMATTYVASGFRTIRFGVTSDHARGKIFEFNRLMDYGGIELRDGVYSVNHDRFRGAVEKLAMDILGLQMFGTREGAEYLLRTDGYPRGDLLRALERIDAKKIPVDLRIRYPMGENWSVVRPLRLAPIR